MTQLGLFARFASGAAFAVVLISACGGKSFSTDGGDGGTVAAGGSTNHAGATNEAGQAHGGTGAGGSITYAGTGSGGGVTAGAGGGPADPACSAAPLTGTCDAAFQRWYHDPSTGICRPFMYGGCGGNQNNYDSLEACQKACPGGNPNYDACKQPSDCVVTGTGCCGICDSQNITPWDLIAYNRQYAQFLQCAIALKLPPPGGDPGAAAPACAACPGLPAGEGTLKYFVPHCVQGQCVVDDLRTSDVTACNVDQDCKVRHGTSCCESCGGGDDIAVRNDGSFENLVCGGAPTPCPGCVSVPDGALAFCNAGRCAVTYAVQAGGTQ